jgi:hypothetical protein
LIRIFTAEENHSLWPIPQDVSQTFQRIIQAYKGGEQAVRALKQSSFGKVAPGEKGVVKALE